jgi:3-hydroxyacyl-CoA dehydrogenase/enoyl-CoA hydratase/3-hydroxybutyryl-CoA epimerase
MKNPKRLLGAAVPGPIGKFPIIELRKAEATDDANVRKVRDWLGGLGWLPVAVGDVPGLVLVRLWAPAWNEIVALLREGARLDAIDDAMVRFGLGRGLLEYLDALGLDQAHKLIDAVREEIEPRVPLDPFWHEVLTRGWRGQASGRGFYRYARGKHQPNQLLVNWLRQEGPLHGPALPALSKSDQRRMIQDRVILLMVNEAFRCLDEGRVAASDDLDLAMMLTDWAPHRGGPIKYARDQGLPAIAGRLRELVVYGTRYEPCGRLLREMDNAVTVAD